MTYFYSSIIAAEMVKDAQQGGLVLEMISEQLSKSKATRRIHKIQVAKSNDFHAIHTTNSSKFIERVGLCSIIQRTYLTDYATKFIFQGHHFRETLF